MLSGHFRLTAPKTPYVMITTGVSVVDWSADRNPRPTFDARKSFDGTSEDKEACDEIGGKEVVVLDCSRLGSSKSHSYEGTLEGRNGDLS